MDPSAVPRSTAGKACLNSAHLIQSPLMRSASRLLVFPLLQVDGDLGEREQAHGDGDEADAVDQLRHVEGEARDA